MKILKTVGKQVAVVAVAVKKFAKERKKDKEGMNIGSTLIIVGLRTLHRFVY